MSSTKGLIPAREEEILGNYQRAVELARVHFAQREPGEMAQKSGALYQWISEDKGFFTLPLLGQLFDVYWPEGAVFHQGTRLYPPVAVILLLLHYLTGARGISGEVEFLPYRLLPEGYVFDRAFQQMVLDPLTRAFGENPSLFLERARELGGRTMEREGVAEARFSALPQIEIICRVYSGDEEIPSDFIMLFSSLAAQFFPAEDLAVLGGLLAQLLLGREPEIL